MIPTRVNVRVRFSTARAGRKEQSSQATGTPGVACAHEYVKGEGESGVGVGEAGVRSLQSSKACVVCVQPAPGGLLFVLTGHGSDHDISSHHVYR